jgi:hypothetical protein
VYDVLKQIRPQVLICTAQLLCAVTGDRAGFPFHEIAFVHFPEPQICRAMSQVPLAVHGQPETVLKHAISWVGIPQTVPKHILLIVAKLMTKHMRPIFVPWIDQDFVPAQYVRAGLACDLSMHIPLCVL